MPQSFDLNDYSCPNASLPQYLWRVGHRGSQTRRDRDNWDLLAADNTRLISSKSNLKRSAEDHFDWRCREASCFLSVFESERHALSWAEAHVVNSWASRYEVTVSIIDTKKLPADTCVFDAAALSHRLAIDHQYSTDELLFLHRIPAQSFINLRSLGKIEEQSRSKLVDVGTENIFLGLTLY